MQGTESTKLDLRCSWSSSGSATDAPNKRATFDEHPHALTHGKLPRETYQMANALQARQTIVADIQLPQTYDGCQPHAQRGQAVGLKTELLQIGHRVQAVQ